MTKEQQHISRKNNIKARNYFISIGEIPYDDTKNYHMHHKDESLKHTDIDRYIEWRIEDLIVLNHKEHTSVTFKGKAKSEATKAKMREAQKRLTALNPDRHKDANNPMYGKKHSEESKAKMRAAAHHKHTKGSEGMHWYTNGIENRMCLVCPDGFYLGRSYANAEVSQ